MNFFSGGGGYFLLVDLKWIILTKRLVLQLVSKKVIQFPAKVPILAFFDYLGPPSKSISSTYWQKFEKSKENVPGQVISNIVFEFFYFKKVRGSSRFASRNFPKSVILASFNFVGLHFLLVTLVLWLIFIPLITRLSNICNAVDSYWYSLTNRRKTSVLTIFG